MHIRAWVSSHHIYDDAPLYLLLVSTSLVPTPVYGEELISIYICFIHITTRPFTCDLYIYICMWTGTNIQMYVVDVYFDAPLECLLVAIYVYKMNVMPRYIWSMHTTRHHLNCHCFLCVWTGITIHYDMVNEHNDTLRWLPLVPVHAHQSNRIWMSCVKSKRVMSHRSSDVT